MVDSHCNNSSGCLVPCAAILPPRSVHPNYLCYGSRWFYVDRNVTVIFTLANSGNAPGRVDLFFYVNGYYETNRTYPEGWLYPQQTVGSNPLRCS